MAWRVGGDAQAVVACKRVVVGDDHDYDYDYDDYDVGHREAR